jgi:hypothetical protein
MSTIACRTETLEPMVFHQFQAGMPPADNNNDEAFLALLSSQRELLNKLNMENVVRREQRTHQQLMMHVAATAPFRHMHYHHMPFLGNDPMSLMNRPMHDRRSSLDMVMAAANSRRLSVGVGHDCFVLPASAELENDDVNFNELRGELGRAEGRKSMKRRRSSFGNLSVMPFDDPKTTFSQRLSISSSWSKVGEVTRGKDTGGFEIEPASFLFDDTPDQQNYDGLQQVGVQCSGSPSVELDPNIDLPTLKIKISHFASAMEQSSKSQQAIHDWDRKMGLKRSHSKTMRLSMRSRKKLRTVMKEELQTIKCATARS